MNILHIDDHDLFSAGLRAHVEQKMTEQGSSVDYLTINTVENAIAAISEDSDRDIIILDLFFSKLDGLFFLRALQRRGCFIPVLVISANEDLYLIKQAFDLGASGFLHKNCSPEIILDVIEQVAQGDTYCQDELLQKLNNMSDDIPKSQMQQARLNYQLSERSYEVLELICLGMDNEQIASALFISKNTLKTYIRTLFGELKVKNRGECIHIAIKRGLVAQ